MRSFINSRIKSGPRTEPCKTPLRTDLGEDKRPSMPNGGVVVDLA